MFVVGLTDRNHIENDIETLTLVVSFRLTNLPTASSEIIRGGKRSPSAKSMSIQLETITER